MNATNASCEECGTFIQVWLSGTPRVCRKCLAGLAATNDVPVRPETMSLSELNILAAAFAYTSYPKMTRDLIVLLDPNAASDVAFDEWRIWYPGRSLLGSEWCAAAQAYITLQRHASIQDSGVAMLSALVLIDESIEVADPLWREPISDFSRLGPACLPSGFSAGFRFAAPVVMPSLFHAYLRRCRKGAANDLAA